MFTPTGYQLLTQTTIYNDAPRLCDQAQNRGAPLDPVPQYLLTPGRSSVVQMCSRSEGAMRLHCDRNKRTQMHDNWPRRR